jgi:hypothetical protein
MNMSTLSTAAAAATDSPPIDLRPRPLTDDVFQSAEEAVRAEGQADSFAGAGPVDMPSQAGRQPGRRDWPFMKSIRSHVAAKPCQSAMLAAAAGALAAIILRSRLRGRLQVPRSSWLR